MFFFNAPPTTEIYTLSLHDALPILSTYWETKAYAIDLVWKALAAVLPDRLTAGHFLSVCGTVISGRHPDTGDLFILRSEEHTSELQSHSDLVCRLLLEKKKNK